jgi:lysophospholipase L1-like esterase
MNISHKYVVSGLLISVLLFTTGTGITNGANPKSGRHFITAWLIGDSTVADYSKESDYQDKRYPITGWGQVFQHLMRSQNLKKLKSFIKTDSVFVDDRAVGGRSTRTFFQEGRWREVFNSLKSGDLVFIQFGHNDASENKPERYVPAQGYQEFLRLFVTQSRERKAQPILVTPVARNYPWKDGKLSNVHGDYPSAMKEVATELHVPLIDLNQLSMDFFSLKGQDYVSANYFMNLPAGKYKAYPDGQKDNTHFQPEGAKEVAGLVFEELTKIAQQ